MHRQIYMYIHVCIFTLRNEPWLFLVAGGHGPPTSRSASDVFRGPAGSGGAQRARAASGSKGPSRYWDVNGLSWPRIGGLI